MLKKGLFIVLFFSFQSAFAQYHPVATESNVRFSLKNFGFKTGGSLDAPEADIVFNPDDLTNASFRVTFRAESINTDNESRDEHLKEASYFDVKNYPQIRFVSSSVKETGSKGSYETRGILTIKNKSKEIVLPFTAEKNGNGWLFSGSFKMNRRDYDIGGASTISDEVTVEIKVLAR
ncbi:MAG TPA: YceI family protein [Puia sp.]|jgi:polyisoprenoid-binding protein YceI